MSERPQDSIRPSDQTTIRPTTPAYVEIALIPARLAQPSSALEDAPDYQLFAPSLRKWALEFSSQATMRRDVAIIESVNRGIVPTPPIAQQLWQQAWETEFELLNKHMRSGTDVFYGLEKEVLLRSANDDGSMRNRWRDCPRIVLKDNWKSWLQRHVQPRWGVFSRCLRRTATHVEKNEEAWIQRVQSSKFLDLNVWVHDLIGFPKLDPPQQAVNWLMEPLPEVDAWRLQILRKTEDKRYESFLYWHIRKLEDVQVCAVLARSLYQRGRNEDPDTPLTDLQWLERLILMSSTAIPHPDAGLSGELGMQHCASHHKLELPWNEFPNREKIEAIKNLFTERRDEFMHGRELLRQKSLRAHDKAQRYAARRKKFEADAKAEQEAAARAEREEAAEAQREVAARAAREELVARAQQRAQGLLFAQKLQATIDQYQFPANFPFAHTSQTHPMAHTAAQLSVPSVRSGNEEQQGEVPLQGEVPQQEKAEQQSPDSTGSQSQNNQENGVDRPQSVASSQSGKPSATRVPPRSGGAQRTSSGFDDDQEDDDANTGAREDSQSRTGQARRKGSGVPDDEDQSDSSMGQEELVAMGLYDDDRPRRIPQTRPVRTGIGVGGNRAQLRANTNGAWPSPAESEHTPIQQPIQQPVQQPVHQPVQQPIQQRRLRPLYPQSQQSYHPPIQSSSERLLQQSFQHPADFVAALPQGPSGSTQWYPQQHSQQYPQQYSQIYWQQYPQRFAQPDVFHQRVIQQQAPSTPVCHCRPPPGVNKWAWLEDHLAGRSPCGP